MSVLAHLALLAPVGLVGAAQLPEVELLDHAALTERLKELASSHAPLTLEEIGLSRAGRPIHALRIAEEGAAGERPALLLVANIDGPQVFSSGVALHLAETLARAATDEVAGLLHTTTLFVIPRANPDAAQAYFTQPRSAALASGPGVDNDRDGRAGEDGPADVNGDGWITHMRVPDPDGSWMPDPTDERALIEADRAKGQRGRWKLYREGRDADGDEEAAEDPLLDAVVNRNFPAGWNEHDPSAGAFPSDEPETRALLDFVLAHPEIRAVVTYGELDSLVKPPQAAQKEDGREIPYPQVMQQDAARMAEIGRRYRAIVADGAPGFGEHAGSFQRWLYQERGLLALNVVLWDVPLDAKVDEKPEETSEDTQTSPQEQAEEPLDEEEPKDSAEGAPAAGDSDGGEAPGDRPDVADKADAKEKKKKKKKKDDEPEPCDDAKRLRWIDGAGDAEAWRFVPWAPFEHPELGPVEIGGLAPFARSEPPRDRWADIAREQLAFVVALGDMLPRTAWVECTARALGGDVYEIEASFANDALLPLSTAAGRRAHARRPARVRLVLSAGDVLLAGRRQGLVEELDGSGARHVERWLVRTPTPDAIAIELDTDGAGRHTVHPRMP